MECVPLSGCANGAAAAASLNNRKEWAMREDQLIWRGVQQIGCKWRQIAAMLPGRSDDAVRNRYNRLKEAEASSLVRSDSGEPTGAHAAGAPSGGGGGGTGTYRCSNSLANLELHSPRTMPSKRAASEVTQAETQAVVKRYRQAIDEVAEEYVCPITAELPIDPVTAEDGRCYERCAIEEWFVRRPQPQVKSPVTNEAMGKRLFPAVQLRNSLKRLVESGAISGSKADAWKKAVAEEAEMAALRVTAEGGDANAMRKLGFSCRDGTRGLKTDLAQSFTWFKRAADLKDVRAILLCGHAYLHGQGVERSAIRGITMIGAAATMGSEHACGIIGGANESGRHGFDMNPQEATRWYREMSKCRYRDAAAAIRENAAAWLREHP